MVFTEVVKAIFFIGAVAGVFWAIAKFEMPSFLRITFQLLIAAFALWESYQWVLAGHLSLILHG